MRRLSTTSALRARAAILALAAGSLGLVFQPFSLMLFSIGCGAVFVSAIVFNLMPSLRAGQSYRVIMRVSLIILTVVLVMAFLAALSAWGYVVYLQYK